MDISTYCHSRLQERDLLGNEEELIEEATRRAEGSEHNHAEYAKGSNP